MAATGREVSHTKPKEATRRRRSNNNKNNNNMTPPRSLSLLLMVIAILSTLTSAACPSRASTSELMRRNLQEMEQSARVRYRFGWYFELENCNMTVPAKVTLSCGCGAEVALEKFEISETNADIGLIFFLDTPAPFDATASINCTKSSSDTITCQRVGGQYTSGNITGFGADVFFSCTGTTENALVPMSEGILGSEAVEVVSLIQSPSCASPVYGTRFNSRSFPTADRYTSGRHTCLGYRDFKQCSPSLESALRDAKFDPNKNVLLPLEGDASDDPTSGSNRMSMSLLNGLLVIGTSVAVTFAVAL